MFRILFKGYEINTISLRWEVLSIKRISIVLGVFGTILIALLLSGCCCCTGSQIFKPTATPTPVTTVAPTLVHTQTPTSTPMPTLKPTSTPKPTPIPEPRHLSTGTYIINRMNGGIGTLEITNDLNNDAVIILVQTANTKYILMSVYVRAHSIFTATGIDDGVYYIYDMTGEDWDSATSKFTQDLVYERFDDSFDFNNYDWTIGLAPVSGGNADYSSVNQNDFPST